MLSSRRILLLAGVPGWVLQGNGIPATVDLNFITGLGWNRGVQGSAVQFLTVSRASQGTASDTSGNWSLFGNNVARITNQGLLVEESRTNSIRNNSMQGAVVGSPGTFPTNWVVTGNSGLTVNVIGTGTENGIDYIDLQITGTSGGANTNINFETSTQIAASNGQTWSSSMFYKISGGTTTNIASMQFAFRDNNSSGTQLNFFQTSITSYNSGFLTNGRVSATGTIGDATAAAVQPYFQLSNVGSGTINITIRIGWPQLELGASVTSPIRTTSAAATRAADVVTLTSPPTFRSAYSLYASAIPNAPTGFASNQTIAMMDDGTFNNRNRLGRSGGGGFPSFFVESGGSTMANITAGSAWAQNASAKIAGSTAAGSQVIAFNGSTASASGASIPVGVNVVRIGVQSDGSQPADAYIQRIAIWPTIALSSAALQSITSGSGP